MIKVMTAAALSMLAAGGVAVAQEAPKIAADLTRAEEQARAGTLFDKLDLNHDGKLDQADRALRVQQRFDRVDTNHDGQISREEFAAQHGPRPGPKVAEGTSPPPAGKPGFRGHRGAHAMQRHGGKRVIPPPGSDHAIMKDAFVAAALGRFDAMDANHDGTVTPAERQAAHAAMREKWQAMRTRSGAVPPPPAAPVPPPPPAG